jgi:YihY family inner membrane protein
VQRRHRILAVTVAVFKKFGDDRGGHWAALVAYYGFFSLFPLLLALTTILAFVVEGNERLQTDILDSALSQFPIIGDQISQRLERLEGSPLALAVGLVGALWAGMAVVLTLETAMDDLWDVPRRARPNFLKGRLRATIALVLLGIALVAAAGLGALGTTQGSFGWAARGLALAGTLLLYVAIFAAAYRYLTVADVRWREVMPGALLAGVGWTGLLTLGSWLVDRQLRGAEQLYGFFAIVLGLLSWIYLGAQLLLLAAELNVVLARRLYPRSLQSPPPATEPDRQVMDAQVTEVASEDPAPSGSTH